MTDEYKELEKADLGAIFSRKRDRGGRFRFGSNPNVEASKGEASAIFGHLNYLKNAGELKQWVIVIEEGRRFARGANLRALLIEGRKFARKVIFITTDWRVYEGDRQGLQAGALGAGNSLKLRDSTAPSIYVESIIGYKFRVA